MQAPSYFRVNTYFPGKYCEQVRRVRFVAFLRIFTHRRHPRKLMLHSLDQNTCRVHKRTQSTTRTRYDGKLVYPVITTYRGEPSVASGCGYRSGSVQYAPAPPDPNACARCVDASPLALQNNCSEAKKKEACTSGAPPPPPGPDPECVSCATKAAAAHECTTEEAAHACSAAPYSPGPNSTCTR
jgi:hypothetical protein